MYLLTKLETFYHTGVLEVEFITFMQQMLIT